MVLQTQAPRRINRRPAIVQAELDRLERQGMALADAADELGARGQIGAAHALVARSEATLRQWKRLARQYPKVR